MNCERARELFSDYLESGMDPALAAVIRCHLQKCPDCAREFESFKRTWEMLNGIQESDPPNDLRHDIVMRAVRVQQDRCQPVKKGIFAMDWDRLTAKLVPARPVAVAFAAAALAFVLLRFPDTVYHQFTGMFSPRASVYTPGHPADLDSAAVSSARTQEWQARKLGRNTVWVTVAPKDGGDGSSVCCVTLSLNKDAFLAGKATDRVAAQVYLLPANQYSLKDVTSSSAIWSGSILEDSPVVVPVLMDETHKGAGTVNLLVTWEVGDRTFGHMIFVPTHKAGRLGSTYDFSAEGRDFARSESSLYAALQGMTEDYGVPVIVNAYLDERPGVINLGRESLRSALTQMFKSTDLDWIYADNAVYVDHTYRAR